ncbi:MAG: hypothetical protein JWN74_1246 [Acidobacteriaceae bacterium]|nr:hypothetical protein [Acidobacteriaceae bacterium]
MSAYAVLLRQELSARNAAYAASQQLQHVSSYGDMPVIVYEPSPDAVRHGNFLDATYTAILGQPSWNHRLEKIHSQAARSLPRSERAWKELDSCMSSDALLMNVFCHPTTLSIKCLTSSLGVESGDVPEFGYKARVPLLSGRTDRTEVDMKLGGLLVESKLTEADFQIKDAGVVESYRDLAEVFDLKSMPKLDGKYVSYQLIRNVLAAHALNLEFCVVVDGRRPDLTEAWYAITKCISIPHLRTRCKIVTWQELSGSVPRDLQQFLDFKYGIAPKGCVPSTFAMPHS